ncbi:MULTISPECIES: hypothetical protein [unclassified Mesorhizobium]|uniref:hypothetical protein n=1 Tax=unclassified Mesorhizobium TaxID=325217 RepID=UPI001CCCE123|nr:MULTISPECIES: hypothetical protein [unclassified Mesorhizobium]MBZ9741012.1 hypothetical protein [Mesorhizobium sp. CO1-1-4]MBZ9804379.1 hypothetical protein [Mesorhizobium sp. ES1-6]
MTGYSMKHPERFRPGSNLPPEYTDPIGEPPHWLAAEAQTAWREFADSLPWLNRSHRGITSIASLLSGSMERGELGISGMNLLRLCLGSMGATPADFSKVGWSPAAEDDDDW